MNDLLSVKGTRDFFPKEMRLRNWLFDLWRKASLKAGFEEYDTCVLEHEDLYIRKAGDEISKQLYSFEDKAGRRLSLRPEMTPSLARLVVQQKKSLSFPIKWFSIPQCFRYERMTKGRRREHFQWNADIIGQPEIIAEVEILILIISALEKMRLSSQDIKIYINDRRILNAILNQLNVPKTLHSEVLIIMDKRDKISSESIDNLLEKIGLSKKQILQLNKYLLESNLNNLLNKLKDTDGVSDLIYLIKLVEDAGYKNYMEFDISIVRGLSYYTGPVFEVNSIKKQYRALCGGGRYNSLLSSFGKEVVPAVGFGFGDVVILDILKDLDKLPELTREIDYTIIPYDISQIGIALKIASKLRNKNYSVDCNFSMKKIKKSLQSANETGAKNAILLFPEELSEKKVVIRDLYLHEQKSLKISELISSEE
tara:strand:- start:99 stop:1373 length:1275 start_codon:yes stop_codon:yes gene_type:complete